MDQLPIPGGGSIYFMLVFCAPSGSCPCLFLCWCSVTWGDFNGSCSPHNHSYDAKLWNLNVLIHFGVYFYLISLLIFISSKGCNIFFQAFIIHFSKVKVWLLSFLLCYLQDLLCSWCLPPLIDGLSKVHDKSHEVPQTHPLVAPELLCLLLGWLLFPLPAHSSCHPPIPVNLFAPV